MALFKLTLRMLSPMLAKEQADWRFRDQPARFMRDVDDKPAIPHPCWHRALNNTVRSMGLERALRVSDIRIKPGFDADVAMLRRSYRLGEETHTRVHEAVAVGQRIVFVGATVNEIHTETLYAVFSHLGEYIGLTPFGFDLGYGRFVVENLEITREAHYAAQTSTMGLSAQETRTDRPDSRPQKVRREL